MEEFQKILLEDINIILTDSRIKAIKYYIKENTLIQIKFDLIIDILKNKNKVDDENLIKIRLEALSRVLIEYFNLDIDLNDISIIWQNSISDYSYLDLLFNLYSLLIEKSLSEEIDLVKLINQSLEQFKYDILNKSAEIVILIDLNNLSINEKKVEIDENIEILKEQNVLCFELNGMSTNFFSINALLKYKTNLIFYYDKRLIPRKQNRIFKKISPNLNEQFKKIEKSINELMFCFYLYGFSFSYQKSKIIYPWWFRSRQNNHSTFLGLPLLHLIEKPKSDQQLFIKFDNALRNIDITRIREIRELIKKSEIMTKDAYSLLIERYFQMFDLKSFQDMILNEFIILESIYTSVNKNEIVFRLSLNIAFFLEDTLENFKKTFNFINDMYSIRSKITHGDKWKNLLRTNKIRKNFREDNEDIIANNIFLLLKSYIDKTFMKIMHWEIRNNKIMINQIHSLFFVENSEILIN